MQFGADADIMIFFFFIACDINQRDLYNNTADTYII